MVSENADMALDDYISKTKIGKGGRGSNRGGRGKKYFLQKNIADFREKISEKLFLSDGGRNRGGRNDRFGGGGDRGGRVNKRRDFEEPRPQRRVSAPPKRRDNICVIIIVYES